MNWPSDFENKIICGDSSTIIKDIPDNSIDLIFSDPPYLKQHINLYETLANDCPRIMKKGASLVTIVGNFALPRVIKIFTDSNKLKYRWTLCMNQFDGNHARMAMGIEVLWKPMLWYVKEAYPCGRGFLRDGVKIKGRAGQKKSYHKWEQDIDWCMYYIDKLTNENDLVLDPFIGSGTVAIACKKLNRRFIGIDICQEYVDIANKRLLEIK